MNDLLRCRAQAVFWAVLAWSMLGGNALAAVPQFADKPTWDPRTLFATWDDDPTTTITLQWLGDDSFIETQTVWYAPIDGDDWKPVGQLLRVVPMSGLHVHFVPIKGLNPETSYRVRIGLNSPEYRFRTMPTKLTKPLVFVTGGDAGPSAANRKVCQQAAKRDVRFAVLGGDLAYANGKDTNAWRRFLTEWKDNMVDADGHMIPMVVTIGNHEVDGGFQKQRKNAPLFLTLFNHFRSKRYNTMDFGDYLSFILLDSDHTTPYEGEQTEWLATVLDERKDVPHLFPVYHQPAYPSHRDFTGRRRAVCRKLWLPLFEKHQIGVVFENDDHTYKRTVPILAGKKDPAGIVYLGDGCWGRVPREVKTKDNTWYIANSAAANHCIIVTLDGDKRTYEAIDQNGETLDRYEDSAARRR